MATQVKSSSYDQKAYTEARERLFNALLSIATPADLEPHDNEDTERRGLRIGRGSATSRKVHWFRTMQYKPYDFRCVLEREVLYDIGDNAPFRDSLRHSFGLWRAIRKYELVDDKLYRGGTFWGALSSGRGLHTHVFIDEPDHREPFVSAMNTLWRVELDGEEPDVDEPHLHPRPGTKFVREFGARKGQRQKTLVATPERQILQEIISRGQAYAVAPLEIPKHPVPIPQPVGGYHHEVKKAFGGLCPKRRRCLVDRMCDRCPAVK